MGVYINMEMPKEGCHHTICIYADGRVSTGGREYTAIPVPPHGRLIDADELFKEMERKGWFDNADRDKAEDLVLDAPTIIQAKECET